MVIYFNRDEEKFIKAYKLITSLGIPCEVINYYHTGGPKCGPSGFPIDATITIVQLYEFLMDKEKLTVLLDKLNDNQ